MFRVFFVDLVCFRRVFVEFHVFVTGCEWNGLEQIERFPKELCFSIKLHVRQPERSRTLPTRVPEGSRSSPPRNDSKNDASPSSHSKNHAKHVHISLEVSSALLVLQHLSTNTTVSLPEFAQTRRRLMFSSNIPKSTSRKTVNTARDQWKTLETWR